MKRTKKSSTNKEVKANSTFLGSWIGREGDITASSLPKDFYTLSPDEQKRIIYKQEQETRKGREFDKIVSFPRIMSEQRTEPIQPDFWTSTNLAQSKTIKAARQLQLDGQLLNAFSLGIDGDLLTYKVIKALQLVAHETSEMYGNAGKELTGSNTLLPSATSLDAPVLGIPKGTKAPAILTTSFRFTKVVLGGRKPNKRDIGKVIDELWKLKSKPYLLYDSHTDRKALMSIVKDVIVPMDGKEDFLYIELQPIFARIAGQNYVRERKDVTLYLCRNARKSMTMLLYEILITALSRGFAGENKTYQRYKEELLKRIAKGRGYKEHPKRVKEDFDASIQMMEKIGLLSKFDYNEIGTVCIFTINKDFLKAEIELND